MNWRIEHTTPEEIRRMLAQNVGNLPEITGPSSGYLIEARIPPEVIATVPGPLARESVLLPFSATEGAIKILFAEPPDFELLQKLAYFLGRDVHPALARRAALLAAIDHHYGCGR